MSFQHHGEREMNPELRKLLNDQQSELLNSKEAELLKRFDAERAGTAQREFPEGRLSGDDDGSITFKIGADQEKNVVALEFSKPTAWVAMPPQQAIELAQALIRHARSIAKEPLTMRLH